MISLLDVAERAQKGPKLEEKDWNMSLFRTMRDLARQYDVRVPSDCPYFSEDDALPDRVLNAAIDFLVRQGVYCSSTGRVVQLTEPEIRQALREQPAEVIVGEGRDQRVMRQRHIEEHEALNHIPALHCPYSEELAPLAVKNYAQMPTADYLEGFNFKVTDGREIYGLPMEAYAARRELAWLRDGVRKAGRPGLAVALYPISTRAAVLVAPMDPDYGLRRTDGLLLSILPDLKFELDMLTAAVVYHDYGSFIIGTVSARAGGFCGGFEGAIIESVARSIVGWICYRDVIHGSGATRVGPRMPTTVSVDREANWAASVIAQTLNTKCHIILYAGNPTVSGPGTESVLVERALLSVRIPINGCNVSYTRHMRTPINASQTPVEADFTWEVAQAVMRMKMTRSQANALYGRMDAWAAGRPAEPPMDVREIYDWVHHRPTAAYQAIYDKVKGELAGLGLDFG